MARLLRWWLYLLAPAALGLMINGDYLWVAVLLPFTCSWRRLGSL